MSARSAPCCSTWRKRNMDFFGIGAMELMLILFVAFIFLGPERMAEVARFLGKAIRELRKVSAELPKLMLEEEEKVKRPEASVAYRREEPESIGEDKDEEKPREGDETP